MDKKPGIGAHINDFLECDIAASNYGDADRRSLSEQASGGEAVSGNTDAVKETTLLEQGRENETDWLKNYFAKALGITGKPPPESVLDDVSFEGIARYIASDKCKKIVTMAGAGISTSAGIPDFRSAGSGLNENSEEYLKKYNISNPSELFSIDIFKENPEPFYVLRKNLFRGTYKPTTCHYFIRLLEKKNKLLRHFTQNIDTLERIAGLGDDKMVEAHGTINTGHCLKCNHQYSKDWIRAKLFDENNEPPIPRCEAAGCGGVVRPDIVFFGESLPKKFGEHLSDLEECDLLLIMGTSLVVQPFASITGRTKDTTPRLYINLEKTGAGPSHPLTVLMFGGGFEFDQEDNIRDVFWEGKCDDGCYALADIIGWGDELRTIVKEGHAKIDEEMLASSKIPSLATMIPSGVPKTKKPIPSQPLVRKTDNAPKKPPSKTITKTTPADKRTPGNRNKTVSQNESSKKTNVLKGQSTSKSRPVTGKK